MIGWNSTPDDPEFQRAPRCTSIKVECSIIKLFEVAGGEPVFLGLVRERSRQTGPGDGSGAQVFRLRRRLTAWFADLMTR